MLLWPVKKIATEMELLERDILPLKRFFEEIVLTRKTEALNTGKYVQITTQKRKDNERNLRKNIII